MTNNNKPIIYIMLVDLNICEKICEYPFNINESIIKTSNNILQKVIDTKYNNYNEQNYFTLDDYNYYFTLKEKNLLYIGKNFMIFNMYILIQNLII